MESDKKTQATTTSGIQYKKADDFRSVYANNVFFEGSLWDMKMLLGQLDQQIGPNAVVQHTAITLPWAQVKLMRYFLGLHLLSHEMRFGRVQIPTNMVPPIPEELPEGAFSEVTPSDAQAIHAAMRECYAVFIEANPEARLKESGSKTKQ
jgi:hypothetical protein